MTARCMLCGSASCHIRFKGQDMLHGLPTQSEVMRCDECGLVFLWPQPCDPSACYPEDYAPHVTSNALTEVAYCREARRGLLRKTRLARQYWQRVLVDIGCAAGEFLASLGPVDSRPRWGMDRSEAAARRARRQLGADVWVGDVPGLPLPNACVDVATMWHVLEHLPDPFSALRDIARVLQPEGVLLLACPMVDSWEARGFGRFWSGYDVPRHLFAFSRQTLKRTLSPAGFDVTEVSNVVWSYNSARISSAFALKQLPILRGNYFLLDWMSKLAGVVLAVGFLLLSRVFTNRGSVGVFVARKRLSLEDEMIERE